MKIIGNMKAYTLEECLDEEFGPIGTPERDAFEAQVQADIEKARLRRERKEARKAKLKSIVAPLVNAINKATETPQVVRT